VPQLSEVSDCLERHYFRLIAPAHIHKVVNFLKTGGNRSESHTPSSHMLPGHNMDVLYLMDRGVAVLHKADIVRYYTNGFYETVGLLGASSVNRWQCAQISGHLDQCMVNEDNQHKETGTASIDAHDLPINYHLYYLVN
jgi:hypothetical protein